MTKEEWAANRIHLTMQLTGCTQDDIDCMSAKQIVLAIMGEDEEDWTLVRASDTEQEIGQTHGEAKLNDIFRMHDEAGIEISQVDSENEFQLNKDLLVKYRDFIRESTIDGDLKNEMIRRFKGLVNSVKGHINNMDRKYAAEKFEEMESDKIDNDYNKVHWNLAEKRWDDVIIKVRCMINNRRHTPKTIVLFKKMYTKLSVCRKRREINYRQFAELRCMISSQLCSLTEDMYWIEKANKDKTNLDKAIGKKNVAGQNIPEETKYVSMDNLTRTEEARFLGTIKLSEDEMIDGIYTVNKFKRAVNQYNGILDGFFYNSIEEMKERWYDRRIINKLPLPTGADNVNVAVAVMALFRCNGSRKEAAKLLEVSQSTLCRRLKDAKELLNSNQTVHPVMKEAIEASL